MKEYPNFYEDIAEAAKRLLGTVVKYDDEFYYVLCIGAHKPDGIFRIYLDPVNVLEHQHASDLPFTGGGDASAVALDCYLETHKDSKILRKMMNSPAFNKFRPFPLGMINYDGKVIYSERAPTRHTQQGLTSQMISAFTVDFEGGRRWGAEICSSYMYDTYKGNYPSFEESIANLADDSCLNSGVAFSRNMALIKGPVNTLFLCYRGDVVGFIPSPTERIVRLAKKFNYLKEIIEDAGIFETIVTEK